jgi:tRNA threonylcarbamoyladenosine biosynthesis protein TsaE
MKTEKIFTNINEAAVAVLAEQIIKKLSLPCTIYLSGDLGAGKTTFTRAMLRALGFQGKVRSPTYTLLESYVLEQMVIYHLDLYRLEHPLETENLGLRDLNDTSALFIIEWPEKAENFLPLPDLRCLISVTSEGTRTYQWCAYSPRGEKIILGLN